MSDRAFNRKAAKKLAKKYDFKVERMLFCTQCGRTVIRTQSRTNPGNTDKIYCTCSRVGFPMVEVKND